MKILLVALIIFSSYNSYSQQTEYVATRAQELMKNVVAGIKYPSEAKKRFVEGIVKIKMEYINCEPTFKILQDIGYGCGDAVMKA